jgi:hypothetical protein
MTGTDSYINSLPTPSSIPHSHARSGNPVVVGLIRLGVEIDGENGKKEWVGFEGRAAQGSYITPMGRLGGRGLEYNPATVVPGGQALAAALATLYPVLLSVLPMLVLLLESLVPVLPILLRALTPYWSIALAGQG